MRRFSVLLMATVSVCSMQTTRAATLTGLTEYSATDTGAWYTVDVWNTQGPDGAANIYVSSTPHASPTFLNSGDGPSTSVSILLPLGRTDLYLFGIAGTAEPYYGLNIFLNGNNNAPALSVFAPVRTDSTTPVFQAASGITPALDYSNVTAANTLTFQDGPEFITIADYWWATPDQLNLDMVSAGSTTPDGQADAIGKIALTVTNITVPEPASLPLLATGVAGLGLLRGRTRRIDGEPCPD